MATKQNILISSCLLGNPVRYNATDLLINHPLLQQWKQQNRLISICPELAGGLPVPRAPAEIVQYSGGTPIIFNNDEKDVSVEFMVGAQKALEFAKAHNCVAAILTEGSPSCGSNQIYDGSFSGRKISGMGITATLLSKNKIRVFNQYQIDDLGRYLRKP